MFELKCKHCCKMLFPGECISLFTAHCEVKKGVTDFGCEASNSEYFSFMSVENPPEWIMDTINQESWTKGKIYCPYCKSRVGSFNFITQFKCSCGNFTTPPIRITHSKVDILFKNNK